MKCFLCGGTGANPRQQPGLTLCCSRCGGSGKVRRDNNIYLQHGVEPPTREELVLLLKQIWRLRELLDAYSLSRRSIEPFPSDLLIDTSEGDSFLCTDVQDREHGPGWDIDEVRLDLEDLLDFDFTKLKAERAERKKRELEERLARQELLNVQQEQERQQLLNVQQEQERQQLRVLLEKYPDER